MPNPLHIAFAGAKALAIGLGVVLKHLFRPNITVEYPEVQPQLPPRSRNRLAFLYDEDSGKMRCIGCTSCVAVCPREIIHMKVETVEKKKVVVQYDVDLGDCIACGNCVEICPVDALELLGDFELAAERKEDLLYDMHKLGKSVPKGYLPRQYFPAKPEIPKPTAAPKPAAPPAPAGEEKASPPAPAGEDPGAPPREVPPAAESPQTKES